jgi:hypothetical protein
MEIRGSTGWGASDPGDNDAPRSLVQMNQGPESVRECLRKEKHLLPIISFKSEIGGLYSVLTEQRKELVRDSMAKRGGTCCPTPLIHYVRDA